MSTLGSFILLYRLCGCLHTTPLSFFFSLSCFRKSTFSNLISLLKFYTWLTLKRDVPNKVKVNARILKKKNPKNIKTQEKLFADCPQSGIKVSFLLQHTSLHYPTGRNTPAPFQRFVHPLEGDDYFVQEKETDLVLEERSNRQETCTHQVAHGNYSNGPCAHSVLALKSCDLQCFQIPGKKML